MVRVAGEAVGTEGHDRVGPYVVEQADEAPNGRLGVRLGTPTVLVVQPHVIGDAEQRERPIELRGADPRRLEPRRRRRVRPARLTAGGGDSHHSLSLTDQGGGRATAQVRLVVGMGPDQHGGAQPGQIGLRHEPILDLGTVMALSPADPASRCR
jgi:hypothetical protein